MQQIPSKQYRFRHICQLHVFGPMTIGRSFWRYPHFIVCSAFNPCGNGAYYFQNW